MAGFGEMPPPLVQPGLRAITTSVSPGQSQKMPSAERFASSAIVIGAGHNGLVAANILAEAGWDVLVCEEQSVAGGAVATAEVIAPTFHTDLFSAFY